MSDAEWNQVFSFLPIILLIQPSTWFIRLMVWTPDFGVVMKGIIRDADICLKQAVRTNLVSRAKIVGVTIKIGKKLTP